MKTPANGGGAAPPATANVSSPKGEKKSMNGELWQGCAGPLVNLPVAGTHVVYFPQGHSEQVAASMKKNADAQIPNYPNLPSKLICFLHSVILHADTETDEVYAQMTLQPVPSIDKESLFRSDLSMKVNNNNPQNEFFCKTLTASDTSSHGGFSVPRRAAERIFPPLDFSMQPPAQEIVATDLHGSVWTFRHVYRGQPKRHLLTSGWSLFVSGKRLFAGDSVLFIRDEKQQLLLGIRRANRQPANLSLSVLSSDSMHIGVLAAAAHAAANYSPFTVFYNPRTSHSEFVIPLAKYYNAVYANQISVGMQFRMMFETEESGTKRHVGTITGVSDLDPLRWKSSQWRNLQVGWDDESSGRERRHRVSIWEIEPVTSPFFICPTPFFGTKRPRQQDDDLSDLDGLFKRTMPWLRDEFSVKEQHAIPGLSLVQWMNMQHNPSLTNTTQPNYLHSLAGSQVSQPNDIQFNSQMPSQHMQPQQQFTDSSQQARQSFINQQQHSKMTCHHSDPINQQLQIPENQTQIQLLKKLQQQQQLLLSQQTTLQPPSQLSQLLDISNSFSGSIATSQIHDVPGMRRSNSQTNLQFSQPSQQPAPVGHNVPLLTNQLSATDGGQLSVLSDDVPSCSTSPSMNNLQPKSDDKTSLIISKSQNQGFLAPQVYNNNSSVPQMETLDNSSSSVTSVCLSLDEKSVNPKHYVEAQDNQRNNMPFSDYQLGSEKDYSNYLSSSGGMLYNYENPKEGNPQLLSSIVSQSFGVPDIAFNSITSTIDDTSFIDRGAWAPKPPMPRMRTYTKVYKRGAVGRSIDIARYSGYEELKQDLARRFGIEGQLEDGQRIGWKLVYMDHESDVLLVGDDPWEEFVNCVNCIKILSHQEVQQMSLDGNSGNIVLPNQAACSGSDDGNV